MTMLASMGCISKERLYVGNAATSAAPAYTVSTTVAAESGSHSLTPVIFVGIDSEAEDDIDLVPESTMIITPDGPLSIQCAVSVLPVALAFAEAFESSYGRESDVLAVGRETALEALEAGECDAVVFSGPPAGSGDGVLYRLFAAEGICVIANTNLGRQDISIDEITGLFTGEIEELDGALVTLVLPERGHPTRVCFEDLFPLRGRVSGMMRSLVPSWAIDERSDADVVKTVSENSSAIGIVSISAYMDGSATSGAIDILTINGAPPGSPGYIAKRDVYAAYMDGSVNGFAFVALLDSGDAPGLIIKSGFAAVE